MSNFSATIPVADMDALNQRLEDEGFGPGNFSVPCGDNSNTATHAGLHCWDIPAFRAALDAAAAEFPALAITEGTGTPNFAEHVAAEALEWMQPTGTVNPVMKGDQRTANGKTWESLIDYNVWPPGVSGWREIVSEGFPAWVQPTGAHDAYALGAKVSFNGKNYESLIPANVWSPAVYPAGWKQF